MITKLLTLAFIAFAVFHVQSAQAKVDSAAGGFTVKHTVTINKSLAHKVLVSDPLAAFGGVSPLQGGD